MHGNMRYDTTIRPCDGTWHRVHPPSCKHLMLKRDPASERVTLCERESQSERERERERERG